MITPEEHRKAMIQAKEVLLNLSRVIAQVDSSALPESKLICEIIEQFFDLHTEKEGSKMLALMVLTILHLDIMEKFIWGDVTAVTVQGHTYTGKD